MSTLSTDDVKHVASLAKINLTKEELTKFSKQLSSIVDFIGELKKVDTSKIDPISQTTGLTNVERNDIVSSEELLTQEEALSGSDETHNGYFKVPALLEGRTDK